MRFHTFALLALVALSAVVASPVESLRVTVDVSLDHPHRALSGPLKEIAHHSEASSLAAIPAIERPVFEHEADRERLGHEGKAPSSHLTADHSTIEALRNKLKEKKAKTPEQLERRAANLGERSLKMKANVDAMTGMGSKAYTKVEMYDVSMMMNGADNNIHGDAQFWTDLKNSQAQSFESLRKLKEADLHSGDLFVAEKKISPKGVKEVHTTEYDDFTGFAKGYGLEKFNPKDMSFDAQSGYVKYYHKGDWYWSTTKFSSNPLEGTTKWSTDALTSGTSANAIRMKSTGRRAYGGQAPDRVIEVQLDEIVTAGKVTEAQKPNAIELLSKAIQREEIQRVDKMQKHVLAQVPPKQ